MERVSLNRIFILQNIWMWLLGFAQELKCTVPNQELPQEAGSECPDLHSLLHQKGNFQLPSPTLQVVSEAARWVGNCWQYFLPCFCHGYGSWHLIISAPTRTQTGKSSSKRQCFFLFLFHTALPASHSPRKAGGICIPLCQSELTPAWEIRLRRQWWELWICCMSICTIGNWVGSAKTVSIINA